MTEQELKDFYEAVWRSEKSDHMIMIKLLIYTGIRNAELSSIKISDVDLDSLKVRIESGKRKKDRYVPIPKSFRGELKQHILNQKKMKANYLFESNRKDKLSTRWIREIVRSYAQKAGINNKNLSSSTKTSISDLFNTKRFIRYKNTIN